MRTVTVRQINFTAFGVPVEVTVPASLHRRALELIPPGAMIAPGQGDRCWQPSAGAGDGAPIGAPAPAKLSLRQGQGLIVAVDGRELFTVEDEASALGMLDAQIRARVALLAPNHIFVHAGVVAVGGRAVVMPGFTFAGKTTLTRALVEAGATYYSDEFAAIDGSGLVHPYPKRLSIRDRSGCGPTVEVSAAQLGAQTGRKPARVGLVAFTSYRAGAVMRPSPLPRGVALLALLRHTIPARTRPGQTLSTLKAALADCGAWTGERGEAADAAKAIIEWMSS